MNELRGNSEQDPDLLGDKFRNLVDRPTPELDSHRLWRGIEARLPERAASLPRTPSWAAWCTAPRLAWGAAAIAIGSLAIWAALGDWGPIPGRQIVLLSPPEAPAPADEPGAAAQRPNSRSADAGLAAPEEALLYLDVRLVRGYDGPPPSDVSVPEPQGAGGADVLRDARARIGGLLPFESFGLVGSAQAPLDDDAPLKIVLSGDYRLLVRSVETSAPAGQAVLLDGLELVGGGQESMPSDLSLEPGRLYILGVLAAGAEDPELVLLIRARAGRDRGR